MSTLPSQLAFVVYHTEVSPKGIEEIGKIYPKTETLDWAKRWKNFERDFFPVVGTYIDIFFRSARLTHPGCKCVVLTDPSTNIAYAPEVEVRRYDLDPDRPAYMRLLAQMKYLEETDGAHHVFFLDYDMLVQQNLLDLFANDFDLALTHERKANRIGGSFILVHKEHLDKGVRYLKLVEEEVHRSHSEFTAWGGIETSMNIVMGVGSRSMREGSLCEAEGLRVLILPAEKYNYAFGASWGLFMDYFPDKAILHFRGIRKEMMLAYWKEYLAPRK